MDAPTFLLQCLKKDLKSSAQIANAANEAIRGLDEKIKIKELELDGLRNEKLIYNQVLKSFNVEPVTPSKSNMAISDLDSLEQLDIEQSKLVNKALTWLENEWKLDKQVLPTDLMRGLEIDTDNDIVAYSLIKWMGVQSLIKRQDGVIIKGPKWKLALETNDNKSSRDNKNTT